MECMLTAEERIRVGQVKESVEIEGRKAEDRKRTVIAD
jgi:hypothetical protein